MVSRIKILPEALINRIAAGEVIERPASIVKELVDNSIDARSTEIIIHLLEGGKDIISVSDNGEGMTPEEAGIAFERHATSKLTAEEDLNRISTLGFRGEALPSIAAVSQIHLTTKTEDGEGLELILNEGKIVHQKQIARRTGTEIEVSDLFLNVPARKKFLRSASTELAYISTIFNQQSLAHYQISFELRHQGKKNLSYTAVKNLKDRVYQIYGQELVDQLICIEKGNDPFFAIEGFISLPPHSYGNRSYQELFVNRRPVKNSMISHAIYEAYDSLLMKGQHPFFMLLIDVDPYRVDVNVHPAKKEVRFSDSTMVYQKIYKKVKETLDGSSFSGRPFVQIHLDENKNFLLIKEGANDYGINDIPYVGSHDGPSSRDLFNELKFERGLSLKVLGQFQAMFLVVQAEEELQIIDQHAAHERILFERFLDHYSSGAIPVQPLLLPLHLDFSFKEMLVLEENEKLFCEMGFEFERFGEKTLLIRAVPAFLSKTPLSGLFSEMVEEIQLFQKVVSDKEKREKMIATMACHGAIKAGQYLGNQQISALCNDLLQLKNDLTCPHGRPIRKRFTLKELEKLFCRI